jgi:hypothetical protein
VGLAELAIDLACFVGELDGAFETALEDMQ